MRIVDLLVSAAALLLLAPLLLVTALLVWLTSPGPALYRARRVGQYGQPFTMYKFRTMREDDGASSRITAGDHDPRVTPLGRLLRATKIDELPQLLNVLCGQMALVGPRPEDPSFLPHYTPQEWEVLAVRPGLTAPAQLCYRAAVERALCPGDDPTTFYLAHVLHWRLALDLDYVRTRTLRGDLRLIGQTFLHIAGVDYPAPRPLLIEERELQLHHEGTKGAKG